MNEDEAWVLMVESSAPSGDPQCGPAFRCRVIVPLLPKQLFLLLLRDRRHHTGDVVLVRFKFRKFLFHEVSNLFQRVGGLDRRLFRRTTMRILPSVPIHLKFNLFSGCGVPHHIYRQNSINRLIDVLSAFSDISGVATSKVLTANQIDQK